MGKDRNRLPISQQQQQQSHGGGGIGNLLCRRRCPMGGVCGQISFKCAVVLVFSVAAFLLALFCVVPLRFKQAGYDARESVKLSASVQAYFKLQKPAAELVPYRTRLEYDVNEEIGVPSAKVAVLSMHPARLSNCTDVVFGFIPDPINSSISTVSLSVLKSSFIDLFLKQYNLTLTSSVFGEPSSFEILEFPGGISMIPEPAAFILQIPQSLFNFTLNSTIYDIKENLPELKEQLRLGLRLEPTEVLYIQVTNIQGSTKYPPVTVEASVASNLGNLLPERLRQLAETITGSPPENLGLNHSVFGKVKEISLSSFLSHSLQAPAPAPTSSPSPAPSTEQTYESGPSQSPTYSPSYSPNFHDSPSPAPSVAHDTPNPGLHSTISPNLSPSVSPRVPAELPAGSSPQIPPNVSPLPTEDDSRRLWEINRKGLVSQAHASSSNVSPASSSTWRIGRLHYS